MIVKGTLKKMLPEISGISKITGKEWKKQDFVIDTGAQFNPELCISTFKENIDTIKNIPIGSYIEVEINLYSKEYNDKYFHNVQAWKITLLDNEETPF